MAIDPEDGVGCSLEEQRELPAGKIGHGWPMPELRRIAANQVLFLANRGNDGATNNNRFCWSSNYAASSLRA